MTFERDDIPFPSEEDYGYVVAGDDFRTAQAPAPARKLTATPFVYRDPRTIPPREWLYGRHLQRRYVAATVAPGGSGKSTMTMVDAVAMATGKTLLGNRPFEPLRVWIWNGEDDSLELERRMAAIMLHYQVSPDDLDGRLFIDNGRDTIIKIAESAKGGTTIATPVVDALEETIRENEIDVVIIDPFVSVHSAPENDNVAMDSIVKTFAGIADRTNCAIELVHHTRKLNGADADVDSMRGASAIAGAVRSARALNVMSADEARDCGVPDEERRSYVRIDNAKSNMAPLEAAKWLKLVSVIIGNDTPDRTTDIIAVAESWERPNALDGITVSDLVRVQQALHQKQLRENAQSLEWAGIEIGKALGINASSDTNKARIKRLIKTWVQSGALVVDTIHDGRTGRQVKIIEVGEWASTP